MCAVRSSSSGPSGTTRSGRAAACWSAATRWLKSGSSAWRTATGDRPASFTAARTVSPAERRARYGRRKNPTPTPATMPASSARPTPKVMLGAVCVMVASSSRSSRRAIGASVLVPATCRASAIVRAPACSGVGALTESRTTPEPGSCSTATDAPMSSGDGAPGTAAAVASRALGVVASSDRAGRASDTTSPKLAVLLCELGGSGTSGVGTAMSPTRTLVFRRLQQDRSGDCGPDDEGRDQAEQGGAPASPHGWRGGAHTIAQRGELVISSDLS